VARSARLPEKYRTQRELVTSIEKVPGEKITKERAGGLFHKMENKKKETRANDCLAVHNVREGFPRKFGQHSRSGKEVWVNPGKERNTQNTNHQPEKHTPHQKQLRPLPKKKQLRQRCPTQDETGSGVRKRKKPERERNGGKTSSKEEKVRPSKPFVSEKPGILSNPHQKNGKSRQSKKTIPTSKPTRNENVPGRQL